ncbi:MAG: arginase family protein, partial [Bacteroidota bacterium]
VGIRDYCNEEQEFIEMNKSRVNVFFDADIKRSLFCGESWHTVCKQIIDTLPDLVYISFDIDALDPKLCPNTGTPVPGGLEFDQAVYLMNMLTDCNKKIIGFDLNEVAPGTNEWDANVGARLLYKMCTIALKSRSRSEASNKSVRNEKK